MSVKVLQLSSCDEWFRMELQTDQHSLTLSGFGTKCKYQKHETALTLHGIF